MMPAMGDSSRTKATCRLSTAQATGPRYIFC